MPSSFPLVLLFFSQPIQLPLHTSRHAASSPHHLWDDQDWLVSAVPRSPFLVASRFWVTAACLRSYAHPLAEKAAVSRLYAVAFFAQSQHPDAIRASSTPPRTRTGCSRSSSPSAFWRRKTGVQCSSARWRASGPPRAASPDAHPSG